MPLQLRWKKGIERGEKLGWKGETSDHEGEDKACWEGGKQNVQLWWYPPGQGRARLTCVDGRIRVPFRRIRLSFPDVKKKCRPMMSNSLSSGG